MKIGYARVSTKDQKLDLQIDALKRAGCEKIFSDVISGASTERPNLDAMLAQCRAGDTVVIYKLDRLGRTLIHLVNLVNQFMSDGIHLQSLTDNIDTSTSQGKLMFNVFASLAEFERDLIRERTQAGLKAARARGRVGGRPKGLSKEAEATSYAAVALYREGNLSVQQIAHHLGISKMTLYKYLRYRGVEVGQPEAGSKSFTPLGSSSRAIQDVKGQGSILDKVQN